MLIFILVISFCCAGVLHCRIMCGKCFILILSSSETAATHKSSFFVCLQFILISGLCLLIIVLFLLQKVTLKLKIYLMNMSQIVSVPHLRRFFLQPVPPHDSLHCCVPPPPVLSPKFTAERCLTTVSHWGLRSDIIENMQHTLRRPELICITVLCHHWESISHNLWAVGAP